MIIYFSGTGNSEYVAKKIGTEINDEVLNIFDKLQNNDYSKLISDKPWVLVVPTYAWRIPRIVHEWIMKTELGKNRDIYFVMTCAGSIGYASKYLKDLCKAKNMNYKGCIPIIMPNNYVALSDTPNKNNSLAIVNQADSSILYTAKYIKDNTSLSETNVSFKDKLNSGFLNDIYYPMFVSSKKFYTINSCISCGKCQKVCPTKNIKLENSKPVWGNNCTHCMSCICKCPTEAIQYGKKTNSRIRYICPK